MKKRLKALTSEIAQLIPPTTPVIKWDHWFAHAVLIAQNGFGKTNVLCCRLRDLIPLIAEGKCSVIIMEPKGTLIDALLHLRAIWKIRDRIVIIDPADTLVAVNIFDRGDGSPQAINATIERLERIFAIVTSNLTPLQRVPLTMAIRALYAIDTPPSMTATTAKHSSPSVWRGTARPKTVRPASTSNSMPVHGANGTEA